jgi:dipeptidyl aminopeptidase/acylaminoacyl peptidase
MKCHLRAAVLLLLAALAAPAVSLPPPVTTPDPLAVRFGAMPAVAGASLSPDGNAMAYVVPLAGQSGQLRTLRLDEEAATPVAVLTTTGNPDRLDACEWVDNQRLACVIWGLVAARGTTRTTDNVTFSRQVAVDADGSNVKLLFNRPPPFSRDPNFGGDEIIDWLPDGGGDVLIQRWRAATDRVGSLIGAKQGGLAVETLDTRTGRTRTVLAADPVATTFVTDGRGNVRLRAVEPLESDGYATGDTLWYARPATGGAWTQISTRTASERGFLPLAVDPATNEALGLKPLNGHQALVALALDGSGRERVVLARDDVDVDGVVRMGADQRIVGVTYALDRRHNVWFDPELEKLSASLGQALPGRAIEIADMSDDGSRALVWAGSDTDPGTWYLHDRSAKSLRPLLPARPQLEGLKLATVKSIRYRARDGAEIPAYLTLPPERPQKGIPAIVMPHGGPSARDEWGFGWMAQYFAARGYAVIQPNFRGSAGYGDDWGRNEGFVNWQQAMNDIIDAGRFLLADGIADPKRLAIFGWSYGGYAALQSAALDPALFRAVVAVAPVTDLPDLAAEYRYTSAARTAREFIGTGDNAVAGSPARRAGDIRAPVLMFHGNRDVNVEVNQSQKMAAALKKAGVPNRLYIFDGLDHYLEDGGIRARLLAESESWMQAAFAR